MDYLMDKSMHMVPHVTHSVGKYMHKLSRVVSFLPYVDCNGLLDGQVYAHGSTCHQFRAHHDVANVVEIMTLLVGCIRNMNHTSMLHMHARGEA